MKRGLRRLVIIVSAMLCVTALGMGWLLFTASGLHFALTQVPGLEVEETRGRLWGRLSLTGLRLKSESATIRVDSLSVDWAPWRLLLSQQLRVDSIEVNAVSGVSSATQSTTESSAQPFHSPIPVSVGSLVVNRVDWQHTDTALVVETLSADSIELRHSQLAFSRLVLQTSQAFVDAEGLLDLALSDAGDVKLIAQYQLGERQGGNSALAGRLRLDGNWSAFQFKQEMSGAVNVVAEGVVQQALSEPQWTVTARLNDSDLPGTDDVTVKGQLQSSGGLDSAQVVADLLFHQQGNTVPARLELTTEGQWGTEGQQITLHELAMGTEPTFLNASGSIENLATTPRFDVNAEWQELESIGQFFNQALPDSTGKLQVIGDVTGYTFSVDADVVTESLGRLNVLLSGQGNERGFRSERADINGQAVSAAAAIAVARTTDDAFAFKLESLTGTYRGLAISADADIEQRASETHFNKLQAAVGPARLSASGTLSHASDLSWNINIPDLSVIDPSFAGRIESHGRLLGSQQKPQIEAEVEVRALRIADLALASLSGELAFGFDAHSDWQGDLQLESLSVNNQAWIEAATVGLSGSLAKHRLDIKTRFVGDQSGTLVWNGTYDAGTLAFSSSADQFPMQVSHIFTRAQPYQVSGLVSMRAKGQYQPTQGLHFDSHLSSQAITLDAKDDATRDLALTNVSFHLGSQEEQTRFYGTAMIDDTGQLELSGSIAAPMLQPSFIGAKLDAALRVNYPNIDSLAALLTPDIQLSGALQSESFVTGSLSQPRLATSTQLSNGQLGVLSQGVQLNKLFITLNSVANSEFELQARAEAGQGTVGVEGRFSLDEVMADLNISANDALFMATPMVKAEGDATLNLTLAENRLMLSGNALINRATINVGSTPGVVQESPDLVMAGNDKQADSLKFLMDLDLDLGQQTTISASGLTGHLVGTPTLNINEEGLLTSVGDVKIKNGKLSILGKDLLITKGIASYAGGAISNPRLNAEAGKTVGDIQVGIRIEGHIDTPTITLFSNPSYPDQDILALLFFDKPLDGLNTSDAIKLASIANALRGGQSAATWLDDIQDSVAKYLGVERLDISFDTTSNQKTLALTSKINSRIDLSYAYNFVSASQSLLLRYQLNDSWFIQSSVDKESGADLVYKAQK